MLSLPRIKTQNRNLTAIGIRKSGKAFQSGSFAGTIWPDKTNQFPLFNFKGNAINGFDNSGFGEEVGSQISYFEQASQLLFTQPWVKRIR